MKRSHRKWHRMAWVLLAPLLAAVIGLALVSRVAVPGNAELPTSLVAPAAKQGS
jgi:hypothetical protein